MNCCFRSYFAQRFSAICSCKERLVVFSRRHIANLKRSFFITTPIFYVNAEPHLGHLYSAVIADAACRFQRMTGANNIIFSTGTDEHGLKIQQAAVASKESTRSFCDRIFVHFQQLFDKAGIGYTDFIRTTSDRHINAVQHFWRNLDSKGFIYKSNYEGWYCTSEETFLTESQINNIQDKDGKPIKVSAETGHTVEWTTESNYMFKLSHFQDDLLHWLRSGNVVHPSKFGDILERMVQEGLHDISVSRQNERVKWGVPVPGDDTQTIYVWLDALVNYLTVAGYPSQRMHWPPDVHVVGKDILKFHGIYWPAFLMAAGLEPPKSIVCHSHWTINHEKMSKSKGNVIDPMQRIKEYTVDAVRYFLLKEGVPHSDGNYSETKLINMVNAELCNTMGNLLQRCVAKSLNPNQRFPGFVKDIFHERCGVQGKELIEIVTELPGVVNRHYSDFNFYKGIESIMVCLRQANVLIQESKPWELCQDPTRDMCLETVLHAALETLRVSALLLLPITPSVAQRLLERLGSTPQEWVWLELQPFAAYHHGGSKYVGRALGKENSVLFTRLNAV